MEKVKKMIDKMRNSLSLQTQKGINAYGICGSDPVVNNLLKQPFVSVLGNNCFAKFCKIYRQIPAIEPFLQKY